MIKSFEGTLAGVAVPLALDGRIRSLSIKNDDAANTYTCTIGGETITVKAGEERRFTLGNDQYGSFVINGTGDYRILASDSEVPPTVDPATAGTIGIADGAVTTVKLADGVLSANAAGRLKLAAAFFNTATVAAAFDAKSIAASKLEDGSATAGIDATDVRYHLNTANAGTVVAAVPAVVFGVTIGNGGGDVDITLPTGPKLRITKFWHAYAGTGAVGDSFTVKTVGGAATVGAISTGSGTANKALYNDTLNPANALFASAASLRVTVVDGGGDPSGTLWIECVPEA